MQVPWIQYTNMNKSWINSSDGVLLNCCLLDIPCTIGIEAKLRLSQGQACTLGRGFASWPWWTFQACQLLRYEHLQKLSSHRMFLHVFLGFASATTAPTPFMKGCHALMYLVYRPRSQGVRSSSTVWHCFLLFPSNGLPQVDVFAHLHQSVVTQSFREVS